MHYQPVVDRFPVPVPLDPIAAILFVAAFVACAIATLKRPSYGVAALAFVQPFAWAHSVFSTNVTFPKVVLLAVMVGLLGHRPLLTKLASPQAWRIFVSLCVVLVATAVTVFVAAERTPVLRETLKAAEYALLFATAFAAFAIDRNDRLVLRAIAISVVLVALTALVQEVIGAPSGLKLGNAVVPRIAGALEGPNKLAGYLEVAIAILGAWCIAAPSRLTALALGLSGTTLVLTFSRGGLAGGAIVVAMLVFTAGSVAWRGLRPLWIGATVGAAATGAWAILVHSLGIFRFTSFEASYSGGVGNRPELWSAAWRMWRSHPLLGIGAGNFERQVGLVLYGVRTHANSWYLQALAEGGIVLFSATIAFLATTIGALWRVARQSPWATGALAVTIALALHQILDLLVFYPKVGGPWIIAIALGVAAVAPTRE